MKSTPKKLYKRVYLAYGRNGLLVDLPTDVDIIQPRFTRGIPDEEKAIRDALRAPVEAQPLQQIVKAGDKVVIVHTDITRATPNRRILPVLLTELDQAGIKQQDITLLNGLGTHRPQTKSEMRALLGDNIVDGYTCIQHDCRDGTNLISLGETSFRHPVRINRTYVEADIKIVTGIIEPHFFAGFSGGPKAILPSLAGAESVATNHDYDMIAHAKASWGITRGNPIWEEMCEVALKVKPDFLVNVTLNSKNEITGVFAGEMLSAFEDGCALLRKTVLVPVNKPYDIVITTNSGYPLDQNLYQAVKGMSAAARIVRKGGAIIIAAACEDGIPDHGSYAELLDRAGSPENVLTMVSEPGFDAQDKWQVQIQAQVQKYADVYVYSDGLDAQQIERALLRPCSDIQKTLTRLSATLGSRVGVLPYGPNTMPYIP
jgi:lactate racemase